jgi:hypothetical protein
MPLRARSRGAPHRTRARLRVPFYGQGALASALTSALVVAACEGPQLVGEKTPDTSPPGHNPGALLRLLVADEHRLAEAAIPVRIEVLVEPEQARALPAELCVKITGYPGEVSFPFEGACQSVGSAGAGGDSTRGCVRLTDEGRERLEGSTIALYRPLGDEANVTIAGAVYPSPQCSGAELATNAQIFRLRGADVAGAAGSAGAGGEGGSVGSAGAAGAGGRPGAAGGGGAGGPRRESAGPG